jgi:hypothetical protein
MFISHLHDNNVGEIGTSCIPTVVYLEKKDNIWHVIDIQEAQDGEAGRKDIPKLFGEYAESFIKKVDYPDYCNAELEKHEEKAKKIYSGDLTYKH